MNTESNILPADPSLLPPAIVPPDMPEAQPVTADLANADAPMQVEPIAAPLASSENPTAKTAPVVAKKTAGKATAWSIVLPNSTVGNPIRIKFDLAEAGDRIEEPRIDGIEKYGVSFDPATLILEGVPTMAGEHTLSLRFVAMESEKCPHCQKAIGPHFQNLPPRREERTVALKWIVNADPKTLWKNLPSDTAALYAKPDSATAFLSPGGKDIFVASQRGRSHAHVGSFRDDAFRIDYDAETRTAFIIVADGAGSAKYSRKGSEIACDTVLQQLRAKMTADFWGKVPSSVVAYRAASTMKEDEKKIRSQLYDSLGNAVVAAKRAIVEESKLQKDSAVKDYATTLLVAVCKQLTDGWFIAAYWVGDGGLGIYRQGKEVLLLGEPDGGEFAGQTRFLTMPEVLASGEEILRRIRFEMVKDFTALVVMSDGITDPKFQTDNNLQRPEKWDELWHELQPVLDAPGPGEETAQRLLQWLDFWSPGNHDDRTIAIML